jgi:hypothetical protein
MTNIPPFLLKGGIPIPRDYRDEDTAGGKGPLYSQGVVAMQMKRLTD